MGISCNGCLRVWKKHHFTRKLRRKRCKNMAGSARRYVLLDISSPISKNRSSPEGRLLNSMNGISMAYCLKQFDTAKQQVCQIAMENAVVIIEVMRNIHANNDFFEKVLCQYQRCKFRGFLFVRIHLES